MARPKPTPEELARRAETTARRDMERRTLDARYWHADGQMITQDEWAETAWGVIWSNALENITPLVPRMRNNASVLSLIEFIGNSTLADPAKREAENIKRTAEMAYVATRTVQRWAKGARGEAGATRGQSKAGQQRIWLTLRGAAREAAIAEIRHQMRAEGLGGTIAGWLYISKDRRWRDIESGADGQHCSNHVSPPIGLLAYDVAAEEWLSDMLEAYGIAEGTANGMIGGDEPVSDKARRARIIERSLAIQHNPRAKQQAKEAGLLNLNGELHADLDAGVELWIGYGYPNEEEPEERPYAPREEV